jgi:hypothetical protein
MDVVFYEAKLAHGLQIRSGCSVLGEVTMNQTAFDGRTTMLHCERLGWSLFSGLAFLMLSSCGGGGAQSEVLSLHQSPERHLLVTRSNASDVMLALQRLRKEKSFVSLLQTTRAKEYAEAGVLALDLTSREVLALQKMGLISASSRNGVMKKFITQTKPPSWGIDRIDGSAHGLDKKYVYPESAGKGVRAYIVDTGIDPKHPEFQGRVAAGFDVVNDGNGTNDCDGHGTHVAGTVGGIFSGVAKKAQLVPVRVLDCKGSGSAEGVVAAIDWIISEKKANPQTPFVANMSLGGEGLDSVDAATARMVEAGVFVAVAAGNETQDACNVSPARTPSVVTVGASDMTDVSAYFSNFGPCLDLYAPGDEIYSAKAGSKDGTIMSGTSMASPHVAGAGVLILGMNPSFTPQQVESRIKELALPNVLKEVDEANLLLQVEPAEDKPDPGQPPPPFPGLKLVYDAELREGQAKSFYPPTTRLKGEIRITAQIQNVRGRANLNYHLYKLNESSRSFERIASAPRNGKMFQWMGENGIFRWEVRAVSGAAEFEFETTYIEKSKLFR